MTIMSSDTTNTNPHPRSAGSDIGIIENNTTAYVKTTGRDVSVKYYKNPVKYRPDGTEAPAIPEDRDPHYGRDTTADEIAASVDAQLIGANGTGMASLANAARFTRRRRAAGAPKMSLSQVMDLKPFRVYRALAELMDEDQIHSPYTQLLDLVLTAKDRTQAAATRAAAADAAFPAEQMSLEYTSKAEQILTALADDVEGETAYRRSRTTGGFGPVAIPDMVYVLSEGETPAPAPADPIEPIDPTTTIDTDEDDEGDDILAGINEDDDSPIDSALDWALPEDDLDAWREIHDREDHYRFMATTADPTWLDDVDDVWDEFDRVEPLLYA